MWGTNICQDVVHVMLLPASDAGHYFCEMLVQVPREALEIAGTSIKFRSGKFGYSICPTIRGSHADFFLSNISGLIRHALNVYLVGDHGLQDELQSNQRLHGRSKGGNETVRRAPDTMSVSK